MLRQFGLLLGILALSGCDRALQSPLDPETVRTAQQATSGNRVEEDPVVPALDLDIKINGAFKPGKPLHVTVKARAAVDVNDATISVLAPDMDRAPVRTLDPKFSQQRLQPQLKRAYRGGRNSTFTERVTLYPQVPGYYRIGLTAEALGDVPAYVDGSRVNPVSAREVWVLITNRGGVVTEHFDTLALPLEAERRAGPLHCMVEVYEERHGKQRDPRCEGALISVFDMPVLGAQKTMSVDPTIICPMGYGMCQDPCEIDPDSCTSEPPPPPPPSTVNGCPVGSLCIRFTYRQRGVSDPVPAPEGMLVEGSYQDQDCFLGVCYWSEERSQFQRANRAGEVIFPCPSRSTEKRLRTAYEFLDEYIAVSRSEWDGPTVRGTCPTGWRTVEMIPNREAFVYGNMRTAARRAHQLFGGHPERTRVDFDHIKNSWYDPFLGQINLDVDAIWGDAGTATQAHEFGHAFHQRHLGGINYLIDSSLNPNHKFFEDSNGSKALLEGFASFFSELVMPGRNYAYNWIRYPNDVRPLEVGGGNIPTGLRSEARVAAVLWDLVDGVDDKGSDFERLPTDHPDFSGTRYGLRSEPFDTVMVRPVVIGQRFWWCHPNNVEELLYKACGSTIFGPFMRDEISALERVNLWGNER